MSVKRRQYTYEEKAIILKRHLVEREALSDLCDKTGCHPTMIYRWQRALFENAAVALQGGRDSDRRSDQQRIRELEAKLAVKNEVLSELMEEHVALEKAFGAR
ncbi:MAG: transposase [Magnetococcales bacterium]|nr:transposase [Magnetococcales bacterium]